MLTRSWRRTVAGLRHVGFYAHDVAFAESRIQLTQFRDPGTYRQLYCILAPQVREQRLLEEPPQRFRQQPLQALGFLPALFREQQQDVLEHRIHPRVHTTAVLGVIGRQSA